MSHEIKACYNDTIKIIDNPHIYGIIGSFNDLPSLCQVKEEEANLFAKSINAKHIRVSFKLDSPQVFNDFIYEL